MFNNVILKLTKRLYPKGRAFRIVKDGALEKQNKGLIISENRAYESTISILDSILPDNDNFTAEDAVDWNRRLGLIDNAYTSLANKKKAIINKMNHPGTIKARQHYLYLEQQLRNSGFDVRVYENRFAKPSIISQGFGVSKFGVSNFGGQIDNPFPFDVKDPRTVTTSGSNFGVGKFGVSNFGGSKNYSLVVNHIDENLDSNFYDSYYSGQSDNRYGRGEFGISKFGGSFTYLQALRSSFYISGNTSTEMSNILLNRKEEFRQLILKTKPAQTVAILLVNYNDFTEPVDFNNDFSDDFSIE
jgi:uncharacterized protein YmfQ (DUF2313 family)